MTIHLDTNFLIGAIVPSSSESLSVQTWLKAGDEIKISSVAWCEFLCGPLSGTAAAGAGRLVGLPTPFLPDEATLAASLFNATGRRRGRLLDCMIAAAAIRAGATIATLNETDFRRFIPLGLQMI
jgi:predicted nucleic acid-binding protein